MDRRTRQELIERARSLHPPANEGFTFEGVRIWKNHGRWWTQDYDENTERAGGVQFSKTPERAIGKLVALLNRRDRNGASRTPKTKTRR